MLWLKSPCSFFLSGLDTFPSLPRSGITRSKGVTMLKALDPSRQIIFQKDWTDFCYCSLLCVRILGTDMAFWGKTSSHLRLGWNRYTFGQLLHTASFKLCWQCLAIWWLARRFMLLSLSPGSSCLQSVLHIVARLTLLETLPAACPCPTQKWSGFLFPPWSSPDSSLGPWRPSITRIPHPLIQADLPHPHQAS